MSLVRVSVATPMRGEAAQSGALADFIPMDEGGSGKEGVIIPVGGGDPGEVQVDPGRYLVRAYLPSGTVLSRQIEVGAEATDLIFESGTPHEWLAWQNLVQRRAPVASDSTPTRVDPIMHFVESGAQPSWEALHALVRFRSRPSTHDLVAALRAAPSNPQGDRFVDDRTESFVFAPQADAPLGRLRYAIVERGPTVDVASVALPWLCFVRGGIEAARIDLAMPRSAEGHVALAVQDPQLGALLGFIGSGRLPAAKTMTVRPGTALRDSLLAAVYGKLENPFAAAAGAYVLLQSDPSPQAEWHSWIENLAQWFPWFPDGAVLHGTLRMRQAKSSADIAAAREAFELAAARGIPVFAPIFRLLLDGVSTLVDDPDVDAGDLPQKLPHIRGVATVLSPDLAFTNLHFGGNQ